MKGLLKTKTFWMSLAGIFGLVGGYVAGEITLYPMIMGMVGFVLAIFIRDAVQKL